MGTYFALMEQVHDRARELEKDGKLERFFERERARRLSQMKTPERRLRQRNAESK
jgi:hypothetical protein